MKNNEDPDLGPIGEGHVCKHGVRWPHECKPCADAAWQAEIATAPAEDAPQCPTCKGHRIMPRSDSYQTGEGDPCPTCVPADGWSVRHELGVYDEHGYLVCHTGLGQDDGPYREEAAFKAKLIVRAVNDHDKLQARVSLLKAAIKKSMPILEEYCGDVFLESIKDALKS